MYNITNILTAFCKVYLRLLPYFSRINSGYSFTLLFRIILNLLII